MSTQGGLIQKSTPSSDEGLKPIVVDQVQLHRDRSASGAGKYYGKLSDGSEEIIGGPGAPVIGPVFFLDASTGDYWKLNISQDGQGDLIQTNVGPTPF